jgi:hypothetical protein
MQLSNLDCDAAHITKFGDSLLAEESGASEGFFLRKDYHWYLDHGDMCIFIDVFKKKVRAFFSDELAKFYCTEGNMIENELPEVYWSNDSPSKLQNELYDRLTYKCNTIDRNYCCDHEIVWEVIKVKK